MSEEIKIGKTIMSKHTAKILEIRLKNILIARKKGEPLDEAEENTLKSQFQVLDPNDVTNKEIEKTLKIIEEKTSVK